MSFEIIRLDRNTFLLKKRSNKKETLPNYVFSSLIILETQSIFYLHKKKRIIGPPP